MSTSGNPKLPRPSRRVIEGLTRQPKSSSKEDVIENNLMTRRNCGHLQNIRLQKQF